ncbi:hypothetical protein M8C17_26855 [Micromonospora sp. RHAY321]|uniref:hypothetical protein n=1 Tax=Micromonospora sp. RHAY321 TaxID=2944807 RepID=UPI00207C6885|nr:hypothetical protein [Micromonospora sp. RHAY321]MCO1598774.1 hypothetical protein [Micromonospora sp. RHAY321]
MSDIDPRLRDRFAVYRAETVARVAGPGPDEARRTLRRRRRTMVAAAAVTAVALAVAPVVANAALRGDRSVPAPAATGEPTTAPTSAPPPTSPAPLTPSTTTSTSPAAPDGRISRAQLLAARVDLPAWPSYATGCATSDVRLRPPSPTEARPTLADLDLGYTDLDGDGATETVALVTCRSGEGSAKQLLAFDRDGRGRIVTMARVVRTGDGLDDITDAAVTDDGEVRAQVADIQPCCSMPSYWAQKQWRTYRWTDDRFAQSDGPRSFGKDTRLTDLALAGGDLVLGPVGTDGKRPGTLTLTVTNNGPVDVAYVGFAELGFIGTLDSGDSSICVPWRKADESGTDCRTAGLRSGERRAYTFHLLVDPAALDKPRVRVVHFDDQDRHWRDLAYGNSHLEVRVVS